MTACTFAALKGNWQASGGLLDLQNPAEDWQEIHGQELPAVILRP